MMKHLLFLSLFALAGLANAQVSNTTVPLNATARKVSDGEVPALIVTNFNTAVKGMVPSWTDNGGSYMAAYKDSLELGHVITYDLKGNVISTQAELGATSYPAPIEQYHDKRYSGEKYTVWMTTDAPGNKMYYFTRNSETIWFDTQGNPVDKSPNKKVKNP